MLRSLCFSVVVLCLTLWIPSVQAQKKNNKAGNSIALATQQDYAQLNQVKEITGKLTFADSGTGSGTLTIRLESGHLEPNPNYKPPKVNTQVPTGTTGYRTDNFDQSYLRLLQDQQRAMQNKNPVQRQQALDRVNREMMQLQQRIYTQQMQQANKQIQQVQKVNQQTAKALANQNNSNTPFKMVTTYKDYELEVKEKVITRRLNLPVEYDDKGAIKEFTKEEKAKLRGKDTTLPGYAAKLEDVAVGQNVKLYLLPAKSEKTAKATKIDNKAKTDGKDQEDNALAPATQAKPTVRMILIMEDAPPATTNPAPKANKKNKN